MYDILWEIHMKKITLLWVAILCMLLIIGCGTKPADVPSVETESEKVETSEKKDTEKEDTKKTEKSGKKEKEPEPKVFTPENFAGQLQSSLEEKSVEDTLKMFEEVPEEYKEDFSINYMHASLLVSNGTVEEALEVSKKLEAKEPNNVDVLFLNSMIAKKAGDTKTQTELLNKIIALEPNNTDALLELAHQQMRKEKPNYKQARILYEKSFKADENQLEAWFGYGQASYYLRKDAEAEVAFNKILEKDPDFSMAYAYLGKLSAEKEKYIEATKYIEKAIELDGNYYDYWVDYGLYLRFRGKLQEAEKAWSKAIEINDQYFLGYVYRASLYDELKQYDKSLYDYRKVMELNPEYHYARENIGMLEFKNGNWTEARNHFFAALNATPQNKENLSYKLMIAATYNIEKNKVEGKKFLEAQMRNLDRASAEYYILRLYLDGIAPSGVDLKIRKLKSVTTKGKLLFYLGLFYDINGNDEMAKKYYTEVNDMQAPMFFEYQLNDWLMNGECVAVHEKKE